MISNYQLRLIVFVLCCITFLMLLINMNVFLTANQSAEPKKIISLLRKELSLNLKLRQYATLAKGEDNPDDPGGQQAHFTPNLSTNDNLDKSPFFFYKNFTPNMVLGRGRPETVPIVIGIPSVKRPGVSYLETTLSSLFDNLYPAEEDKVSIVVYLAETDSKYVAMEMKKLSEMFPYEVESGLLQVISAPVDLYPAFDTLPQTLGDSPERVKWRSKEVVDALYLMFVCRNKAKYYLMLEDDVAALRGYFGYLEEYAAEQEGHEYAFLSFSRFNSIGKLFPAETLPKWASFLMTFYGQKPVDWLMADYVYLMSCYGGMQEHLCQAKIRSMVPKFRVNIFNHIGGKSSLNKKTYVITDDTDFSERNHRKNSHENPEAEVVTDFKSLDNSSAESMYLDSGGKNQHFCFVNSQENDKLTITFSEPAKVHKILLKSGKVSENSHYCDHCAVIEVLFNNSTSYTQCSYTAWKGASVCKPDDVIKGFRIRNEQNLNKNVCFNTLFVQT